MPCDKCEHDPCQCPKTATTDTKATAWLIQDCATPGCSVKIRLPLTQQEPGARCKWCVSGQSARYAKDWPDGMPDPNHPWPWLDFDPKERERRLKLPYWQDRFRNSPDPRYHQYVIGPLKK